MNEELNQQLANYVQDSLKQAINTKLEEKMNITPITVGVNELAKLTSMSASFLNKSVIDTPIFNAIEVDAGRRRLWYAEKVPQAWNEWLAQHGKPGMQRMPEDIRQIYGKKELV